MQGINKQVTESNSSPILQFLHFPDLLGRTTHICGLTSSSNSEKNNYIMLYWVYIQARSQREQTLSLTKVMASGGDLTLTGMDTMVVGRGGQFPLSANALSGQKMHLMGNISKIY